MFIVYSKPNCPFCVQAKGLLKFHGKEYFELMLDLGQKKDENFNYVLLKDLEAFLPGVKSVPQIFEKTGTHMKHVGGFAELREYLKKD
jgi:glutaredoxin